MIQLQILNQTWRKLGKSPSPQVFTTPMTTYCVIFFSIVWSTWAREGRAMILIFSPSLTPAFSRCFSISSHRYSRCPLPIRLCFSFVNGPEWGITHFYGLPYLVFIACHSGRTLVFDWRTFPVLRLTYSWRVTTYVGKASAMVSQPGQLSLSYFWGR